MSKKVAAPKKKYKKFVNGFVVGDSDGTIFYERSVGNSEYDDHIMTLDLRQATVFETKQEALDSYTGEGIEYTKAYWGSKRLANFLKDAVVFPLKMGLKHAV